VEDIFMFLTGITVAFAAGYALRREREAPPEPIERPTGLTPSVPAGRETVESVVDLLSEGIIVLNDVFQPVVSNAAARRLVTVDDGHVALPPDEVMSVARRAFTSGHRVEEAVDLWNPDRRSVLVSAQTLSDQSGVLVSLRDISSEQRALRQRRQFVSHASHELKSPVASIQALAEAIAQASGDDPGAVKQFAEKMLKETARVARLVNDLLDLSRIEDPASFRREAVDVSRIAQRLIAEVGPSVTAKDLELRVAVEDQVLVQADEQQVALLIRNLLDNAIRYTGPGGQIRVHVGRDGGQAVIQVSDDGIGIPLKSQARVFERFYRVDEGRSRDLGGSGLGLAIVKHVTDLYGGRVELQSEFGEGSTFTAYLPALSTDRVDEVRVR
jgi:signal transduction histidine kinase